MPRSATRLLGWYFHQVVSLSAPTMTAHRDLIVIVTIAFLHACAAYPIGPPASTCFGLFPKHGVDKQSGPSPYRLVLSNSTYTPEQVITVKVESTVAGKSFKGFQVVVHRVASSGNAEDFIGTFTVTDSNSTTVDCKDIPRTMLAHNSSSQKVSVSGLWTAPMTNEGNLTFVLTVVESLEVLWSKISVSLQAASITGVVPPKNKVPAVSSLPSTPDWVQCGLTKGCWMVPPTGASRCNGINDCKAAISYRRLTGQDLYHFEMAVKGQDQFIAVGFSEDKFMGEDQTVTCTSNVDYPSVQLGYNTPRFNDKGFTVGLWNLTAGQADGQVFCSFVRNASLDSSYNKTVKQFNINNPYHLFLAWGPVAKDTDVMLVHLEPPRISDFKVNLSMVTITGYGPSSTANSLLLTECHFYVQLLLIVSVFITL